MQCVTNADPHVHNYVTIDVTVVTAQCDISADLDDFLYMLYKEDICDDIHDVQFL